MTEDKFKSLQSYWVINMFFDSLAINLVMLIPTAVFAVVVEKHYTAFWIGIWNLFALGVTGLSLFSLLIPPTLGYWRFLPYILILMGFVMMVLSFLLSGIARIIGSSHIATSVLFATYLFQYTISPDVFWIALIGSFVGILLTKIYFV